MDYSKTLNLPATEFPMRGNLPNREPEFLDFWEKNEIYTKNRNCMKAGRNGCCTMGHLMPTGIFIWGMR